MRRFGLQFVLYGGLAIATSLMIGCSNTASNAPDADQPANGSTTETLDNANANGKTESITLRKEDGSEAVSIQYADDKADVLDASGNKIASLTIKGNGSVTVEDASGKALGSIRVSDNAWKIQDAAGEVVYTLRQQGDKGFKLLDAKGEVVYTLRVTQEGKGLTIRNTTGEVVYRVRTNQQDLLSLRDADNKTILRNRGELTPVAIASFSFSQLSPEQQAALAFVLRQSTPAEQVDRGDRDAANEQKPANDRNTNADTDREPANNQDKPEDAETPE
jgi:uncharacterized protein YxjI